MDDIYRIAEALQSSGRPAALATIIRVDGSAYRKAGTSMLFQEGGGRIGTLSGGCLEEDLAVRAEEVMADGLCRMIEFDLRSEDDWSWGQGAGCNGVIYVLMEAVGPRRRSDLLMLKSHLDRRQDVLFVHRLTPDFHGQDYLYMCGDGHSFGTWEGGVPQELLAPPADPAGTLPGSGIRQLADSGTLVYTHCYRPRPRLIIIGAGPGARPLASMAKQVGFAVTVADWREALCNPAQFPDADEWICGFPERIANGLQLTRDDFVILMTHQFQRDRQLLSLLADHNPPYIGVLGSARRVKRLWGIRDIPPFLHSPVGLPIGAEGPEEIAVSILAEVISAWRGNGKPPASTAAIDRTGSRAGSVP